MAEKNQKPAEGESRFDIRNARRFDRITSGMPAFSIQRKRVLQAVKLAGQFIEDATNGVAEKYQSVFIEALRIDENTGVVRMTTKSSSSGASISLPCPVDTAGAVLVRHDVLMKSLSTIKANEVSFLAEGNELGITGAGKGRGSQSVSLPLVRINDESELPDFDALSIDDSNWLAVSQESLLGAVKVLPKPDKDARASLFSGLVFSSEDGKLEVLSTNGDSYSSLAEIECEGEDMPIASLLYPQVNEVLSDIEPDNSGVRIGEHNNKIVFTTDSGIFSMPSVGNIGASSGQLEDAQKSNAKNLNRFGEASVDKTAIVDGKKLRSAINSAQDMAKVGGVINSDSVQVSILVEESGITVSTEDEKTYVESVEADVEVSELPERMFVIPSIYPDSINAMTVLSHDGDDARVKIQFICRPGEDGNPTTAPLGIFITGYSAGTPVKNMIAVRH